MTRAPGALPRVTHGADPRYDSWLTPVYARLDGPPRGAGGA
jgi:hypothetical protein